MSDKFDQVNAVEKREDLAFQQDNDEIADAQNLLERIDGILPFMSDSEMSVDGWKEEVRKGEEKPEGYSITEAEASVVRQRLMWTTNFSGSSVGRKAARLQSEINDKIKKLGAKW